MQQNFQQARPEIQSLRQKRLAFDNATPGTSQFQSAANDLAQAESTAAHDQVLRQADLRTKIYNLLTAEQRTKLASLIQQRQQQMQQRRAAAPAASH
jgi:Spy/CpxP family protein refolding chaperone